MDWDMYLRACLALVLVLGLISGAAWLARRFGMGRGVGLGRKRRLSVIETLPLDGRRRLVLVRDGEAEHLLLVGGGSDMVVESRQTTDNAAVTPSTPQG